MHSKIMIQRMKDAESSAKEELKQIESQIFQVKQRQYFLEMAKVLSEKQHAQEVISPIEAKTSFESIPFPQVQWGQQNPSSHYSWRFTSPSDPVSHVTVRPQSTNLDKWDQNFQDLLKFRKVHGHCLVPYQWRENKRLAHWVKRQRYYFKLKKDGVRMTLTDARQEALDKLGFVWEPHDARWEERLNDLVYYKKVHGTCNVRSTCTYSPRLADWVKSQRRNYRNFIKGKPSKLTHERIQKMNALGFIWNPKDLDLNSEETK